MMVRIYQFTTVTLLVGILSLLVGNHGWAQQSSNDDGWHPEILEQPSEEAGTFQQTEYPPYLPDFSYAGYRWGEEPIPEPRGEVIDVTDFGAVPNNGEDDTEAIRDALDVAHETSGPVVVRFPSGRFIVREVLFIERGNFVIQGSGSDEGDTELYFPRPLNEMEVAEDLDAPDEGRSPFSSNRGVIWPRHPDLSETRELASAVAGRRGHHTIKTEAPTNLRPGDVVEIRWFNRGGRDGSLLRHIYCSTELQFGSDYGRRLFSNPGEPIVMQEVTVEHVEGRTITVKEPLFHDLREDWSPTLNTIEYLEGVGIEHLRITFPGDVEYAGHGSEEGYNGIHLENLLHSWVRDVTVDNTYYHEFGNDRLQLVFTVPRPKKRWHHAL